MNHVHIAGHLGADPEVRFTSGGQKVTVLRVACNNKRSGKEETIWWKVTIWGEQFDKMITYFKKGSPIMVFGELSKPEIYTDRDGKPQISLNLTASSLQFSPFGRSQENKPQAGMQSNMGQNQMPDMTGPMKKENPQAAMANSMPNFDSGGFQPTDMMQGQGPSSNFNDDEIPF